MVIKQNLSGYPVHQEAFNSNIYMAILLTKQHFPSHPGHQAEFIWPSCSASNSSLWF
jgi:hypothetical protein